MKTELTGRIQDESKERADIIRDTLAGIEGEIVAVKDLVQREKSALEEAILESEEKGKKGAAEVERVVYVHFTTV